MRTFKIKLIVGLFAWAVVMLLGSYVHLTSHTWYTATTLVLVMTVTFGFEAIFKRVKNKMEKPD
ncbi:hypothetical protein [Rossellomorea marisflavi]|uniref:hypothetical protein n=1 Tax=Rossellomorea marisflavi TaxID=189381 RepID=UPI003FA0BA33